MTGRSVLITGAASGIGAALAAGLAGRGWSPILVDIDRDGLARTAETVGERLLFAETADLSDPAACAELGARIAGRVGALHGLVNCAGIVRRGPLDDPNMAGNWADTFAVNVSGAMHLTRALLPALEAAPGAVLNMASIAAYRATPNNIAYDTSKAAVRMLTQSMAVELAPRGVRVNALAPGVIETPMNAVTREDPEKFAHFLQRIPMRRSGKPEELVGAAAFLLSSEASYITGAILPVDGGFLAN